MLLLVPISGQRCDDFCRVHRTFDAVAHCALEAADGLGIGMAVLMRWIGNWSFGAFFFNV